MRINRRNVDAAANIVRNALSLKVPISLREKLLYIAWAIIPGFMSKCCKNKTRIKAKDN